MLQPASALAKDRTHARGGEAPQRSPPRRESKMQTTSCDQIRAWLLQPGTTSALGPPDELLCSHVAACPTCRGAVVLLLTELLHAPLPIDPIPCDACQAQLAAFIDLEQAQGVAAALMAYPTVCWHLWTCADCAEIYHMTMTLLASERQGELAPIPLAPQRPQPRHQQIGQIRLPRALLQRTLAVPSLLGMARGADEDETVLATEDWPGCQITLSVRRQDDGSWTGSVTAEPPVSGRIVLTLGTSVFTASFDPSGIAVVAAIPRQLLIAPESPAMTLSMEADPAEADAP